jgi:serine/threonine protein kinase
MEDGRMMSRDTSESASGEEALFHAARSLPDRTAREAFLVAACQGRSELRARVEGLLTASEDSAAFFGAGPGAPVLTKGLVVGARLGNYEVLSEIGRGGMGRVYRATEVSTRRVVALKVIGAGSAADSTQVRRFQTEAQAAAQLHHPNIVTIHEAGFCDGVWFFSMDLIDGQPLSTLLASTFLPSAVEVKPGTGMNGFLEDSFSLVQFCKIVRAVHYAHEHGVLHRDLKPANILVDSDGEPHLIDFGLAKVLIQEGSLTRTADVMGSPSYMAPEQACGKGSSIATDVYGLGAILYELLTGQPPFRAESPVQTLREVIEQAPLHPTAIRPQVDTFLALICLRCLEKDPRHRYPSALALAEDLERWESGEPILTKPQTALVRSARWARRNPLLASFMLTLVLGLTATSVLLIQVNREKNKQALLATELKLANRESTRLLARAVGMVSENLETLWSNGERNSMLVGSDEIAAIANRPVAVTSSKLAPTHYVLGLMAEDSPTGRAQRYADLLAYLEQQLELRVGRPVRVDVRFYKYLGDCRADLCAGKLDFVRCGALPFLRSRQQVPGLQPIAVPVTDPKLAVLFTRAGSEIRSLADLKGRRVAFGETNSTVSFRAQIELARRGIDASQLGGYDFLDSSLEFGEEVRELGFEEAIRRIGYLHSHAQVIEGVLSGRYDAGVAAFRAFQINHSRGLAAISDSEFVSSRSMWVARAGLEAQVVNGLREALISLRGEPWMALLPDHPVGFELMTPATFSLEENWLTPIGEFFPFKPSPPARVLSDSARR